MNLRIKRRLETKSGTQITERFYYLRQDKVKIEKKHFQNLMKTKHKHP